MHAANKPKKNHQPNLNHQSITMKAPALLLLFLAHLISAAPPPSTHLDPLLSSLSVAGYTTFASAVRAHVFNTTTPLTYFTPPDASLEGVPITSDFVSSHIALVGALPYRGLVALEPGALVPTLAGGAVTLTVTESMGDHQSFSINDVRIDVADLYFDGTACAHGVEGPLVSVPRGAPTPLPPPQLHLHRHRVHRRDGPKNPRKRRNQRRMVDRTLL